MTIMFMPTSPSPPRGMILTLDEAWALLLLYVSSGIFSFRSVGLLFVGWVETVVLVSVKLEYLRHVY